MPGVRPARTVRYGKDRAGGTGEPFPPRNVGVTMPQLDRLSACPRCAAPLDEAARERGRFCGACGADLSRFEGASSDPSGASGSPALEADAPAGREQSEWPPAPPHAAAGEPADAEGDFLLPPPEVLAAEARLGEPVTATLSMPPEPAGVPESTSPTEPGAPSAVGGGVDPADGATDGAVRAHGAETPAPRTPPGGGAVDSGAGQPGRSGQSGQAAAALCVACGTGGVDGNGYCRHCGHKQPGERDHMEREAAGVAAASDRGLRHHRNEDFFAVGEATTPEGALATITVVCDGVSSASRSDEASAVAAETAAAALRVSVPQGAHPQQAMSDALVAAGEAVTALAADAPNEPSKNAPACTVVGALSAHGILTVGWVGDSRAYWVPEDRAAPSQRLTEDDSWAAQMVAAGLMDEAEAYADARAHAITGWLGADAYEVDPHTASFRPEQPGVAVVCTDGLWNYAESAQEMADAVPPDARERPLDSARRLVGYALDGGGHDNVTVAIVPFPQPDPQDGPEPEAEPWSEAVPGARDDGRTEPSEPTSD